VTFSLSSLLTILLFKESTALMIASIASLLTSLNALSGAFSNLY